jgi:hypothetical protein
MLLRRARVRLLTASARTCRACTLFCGVRMTSTFAAVVGVTAAPAPVAAGVTPVPLSAAPVPVAALLGRLSVAERARPRLA